MKTIQLGEEKEYPKNKEPEQLEPTITEDCVFLDETGTPTGFYLRELPEKLKKILDEANNELLSARVPKSTMNRVYYEEGKRIEIAQYSVIVGATAPGLIKRRYKPGLSHLHMVKSAERYIKLIYLLAQETEKLVEELMPEQAKIQRELIAESQKIKVGTMWTSSIANFNSASKTHKDGGNLVGCFNAIFWKREGSKGGHFHLPGYDAVIDSVDGSLLFYPAYRNVHGVSPIIPTRDGGYRNSIVLYPLDIKYD